MPGDTNTPNPADYLGYDVYAQTLWARIETALNKDADGANELGDDPLVVGIFGEWGAGKSKLLQLVQKRAIAKLAEQRQSTDPGFHRTVPVYFQPWKYEHEPHLHVPLVLHITQALKDALKQEPGLVDAVKKTSTAVATHAAAPVKVAEKTLEVARALFKPLKIIAESISLFGFSLKIPDELGEFLDDGIEALGSAKDGLDEQEKLRKDEKDARDKRRITYTNEGLYFYRINEFLRKLTRPAIDEGVAKDVGAAHLTEHARINFVIFIDDLDRCLPEKAVETLELIKTVFNLESFAFVLALDEEVVERGIGHRYKDYALAGKKPEMPITGFEYLEKIVHLPFRLPALRTDQGRLFLRRYENELLVARASVLYPMDSQKDQNHAWIKARTWFSPREIHGNDLKRAGGTDSAGDGTFGSVSPESVSRVIGTLSLDQLVIKSFTAHVPRKLIRVVELFHQVIDVLEVQEPERLSSVRVGVHLEATIDPRTVLALLLLQLFQPDLSRTLRRTGTGFEVLLAGFAKPTPGPTAAPSDTSAIPTASAARALSDVIADADLLHWALYWEGLSPPTTVRAAQIRVASLKADNRHAAQRIRLPIAERILEHRAAQRHVFDPLQLFFQLHSSALDIALGQAQSRHLFAFLGQAAGEAEPTDASLVALLPPLTPAPAAQDVGTSAPPRWATPKRIDNLEKVYGALVSPEEAEQARAPEYAELSLGECFDDDSAKAFRARIKLGLDAPDTVGAERVLRGLQVLAAYFSKSDGRGLWELVKDALPAAEQDFNIEITDLPMLKRRELWADVRSTLGADDRFVAPLWLPKERYNGNSEKNEPIPGFVRVKVDLNKPEADFFIARTLTTVDQYAAFMATQGYETDKYWDTQGIDWRNGTDSNIQDPTYREYLKKRTLEMRKQPMLWEEQRAHGARAVWGVNWFEARAYARWLDAHLAGTISGNENIPKTKSGAGGRLRIMLPTEAQWQRAATAADFDSADDLEYPWAKSNTPVHLHANIGKSEIGRASVVGLFPTNPLGASDLAGNVWEWQNGVYEKRGEYDVGEPIPKIEEVKDWLVSGKDYPSSDCPALRGGSWNCLAGNARVSIRSRIPPVNWNYDLGFRVVLSLAKNEP